MCWILPSFSKADKKPFSKGWNQQNWCSTVDRDTALKTINNKPISQGWRGLCNAHFEKALFQTTTFVVRLLLPLLFDFPFKCLAACLGICYLTSRELPSSSKQTHTGMPSCPCYWDMPGRSPQFLQVPGRNTAEKHYCKSCQGNI